MSINSQKTTNNTDSLPNYVKEGQSSVIEKPEGLFGMHGWICPKCGRVYSPYTSMCSYCKNDEYKVFNSSNIQQLKDR